MHPAFSSVSAIILSRLVSPIWFHLSHKSPSIWLASCLGPARPARLCSGLSQHKSPSMLGRLAGSRGSAMASTVAKHSFTPLSCFGIKVEQPRVDYNQQAYFMRASGSAYEYTASIEDRTQPQECLLAVCYCYCLRLGLQALLVFNVGGRLLPRWGSGGFGCFWP